MAEALGFARTPRDFGSRAAAPAAGVLPALLVAMPVAAFAGVSTLVMGGGVPGALAAYACGGAVTLVAAAVAFALPWRRVARRARRWAAQGAASPAQLFGR